MLNKKRLLISLVICTGLTWMGCNTNISTDEASTKSAPQQVVAPDTLKALLPETIGQSKPIIVDIYSQFCLACQQVAPKLEQTVKTYPQVTLKRVDIQKAQGADQQLVKAFGVVTVPYIAFIDAHGQVKHVLLEDASQAEVDRFTASVTDVQNTPQP